MSACQARTGIDCLPRAEPSPRNRAQAVAAAAHAHIACRAPLRAATSVPAVAPKWPSAHHCCVMQQRLRRTWSAASRWMRWPLAWVAAACRSPSRRATSTSRATCTTTSPCSAPSCSRSPPRRQSSAAVSPTRTCAGPPSLPQSTTARRRSAARPTAPRRPGRRSSCASLRAAGFGRSRRADMTRSRMQPPPSLTSLQSSDMGGSATLS